MSESEIIDENWVPAEPEIITGTQFQCWCWTLQRPWPTLESEIIEENWVPAQLEIITGTQFYCLLWNLHRPSTTLESEITNENWVPADPKSSPEPSSKGDAEIFSAHGRCQNQKSLRKTESLPNQKSSPEPSSNAEVEIFNTHGRR